MVYKKLISNPPTPQNQQTRPDQIKNNAGGYAFALDCWSKLDQFLLLGTEAGTYYVDAHNLTAQNLDNVKACLREDGRRVVRRIVEISKAGRAIKNDPAILVLAAAISFGDNGTKAEVKDAILDVCRTGTHILHFVSYADSLRKWGRSLRSAVAFWYMAQDVDKLAYQMVKYQNRDQWTQRDAIRLSHAGSTDPVRAALFDWALHGPKEGKPYPTIVAAFENTKGASADETAKRIEQFGLSREMIPTDKLNAKPVARALAKTMPMTAMIRNLGNLSKADLLTPGDEVFTRTISQLGNVEALKKARVHPVSLLIALKTYQQGHGTFGHNSWPVVPQVADALNEAFYKAFNAVEPLNKNLLIAVDVSGSMSANVVGTPNFSAAEAAACMALVTARTEPNHTLLAFDTVYHPWTISAHQRLDDVMRSIPGGGGTNVGVPIRWAINAGRSFDAILIYTDSESWAGTQHVFEVMAEYRRTINPKAKCILLATAANGIGLNAPEDPLSLTICGFDASVPDVIRAFLAN
jgi:60 kDa SS-A/Ro ribonucleoprotein